MQSIEDDYLYDTLIAAVSRDDISLLLYIWTDSFKRGRESIETRRFINDKVPQMSDDLGYSATTFSDLVRRWYWTEIAYLFENDFPALVELLRDTPYRAPSDAFVEYFPSSSLHLPDNVEPEELGQFIFYLCLKSAGKEGLEDFIGALISSTSEEVADEILLTLTRMEDISPKIVKVVFDALMSNKDFLYGLVLNDGPGIKLFLDRLAPVEGLNAFMSYLNRNDDELDLSAMPEARKYELIRAHLQSHLRRSLTPGMIAYLKQHTAEGHNYHWFGRDFVFRRDDYVSYFGEDEVLTTIENL